MKEVDYDELKLVFDYIMRKVGPISDMSQPFETDIANARCWGYKVLEGKSLIKKQGEINA